MTREERCRRALRRDGFVLLESRTRQLSESDRGGYRIVDENNCLYAGARYELTLDDVEAWVGGGIF
jgi:hypothetical protein